MACKVSAKTCHKSVAKLKLKDLCAVFPLFDIFYTWSHLLDQNVVPMPKDIKFGSWEVRAKVCNKSVQSWKLKNSGQCCHFLRFLKKKHTESLSRPKCSSHTKNNQYPFSRLGAYPVSEPASQPLTDSLLYIVGYCQKCTLMW